MTNVADGSRTAVAVTGWRGSFASNRGHVGARNKRCSGPNREKRVRVSVSSPNRNVLGRLSMFNHRDDVGKISAAF